ncbi:MAG: response regulator transcription factor [Deltaproteobacteria bacterium]|nr:response regulator transcription factor [Deltaproteobacteria bacterium]
MNQAILIIDDDAKLNTLLEDYLRGFGFRASSVTDPGEGLRRIRRDPPDLVILDVMMPGMDGFEACKTIRRESAVPIVMLTARGEVMDRIVGLELGADDYLPKPFEPRELVARIQSVLRRHAGTGPPEVLRCGPLTIDLGRRSVLLDGAPVDLTTTEFEVLALFARNPGKVLTREAILEELRGIEWESYNRAVDVVISRLRHKLGDDPKYPRLFKTVWGAGYAFIGEAGGDRDG